MFCYKASVCLISQESEKNIPAPTVAHLINKTVRVLSPHENYNFQTGTILSQPYLRLV
jgi:hypothetical protein